jgi:hypothetical protein
LRVPRTKAVLPSRNLEVTPHGTIRRLDSDYLGVGD